MTAPNEKMHAVYRMLSGGAQVEILLDARHRNVCVPKHLQHDTQLVLLLGYDMPIPIPDLTLSEQGIGATLSFNRAPFWCYLPWDAIFGARVRGDAERVVWAPPIPDNVVCLMSRRTPKDRAAAQARLAALGCDNTGGDAV
jgi:hypothetical protein